MRRQFIIEHLMADFAKDEVLAVKLSFRIDIDRGQQDRPVRQRIPTLAIGEDVFIRGKELERRRVKRSDKADEDEDHSDWTANDLNKYIKLAERGLQVHGRG